MIELPLTSEGLKLVKVGMTCGFEKDGVITRYKVKRINRKKGKCWAEPVTLYTPTEFGDIMSGKTKDPR